MKNESYYRQVASQMLHAILITGDGSAATLVLQQHVTIFPPLSDGQFLAEMEAIMDAYYVELDRLDIFAAAMQPEFFGLRTLMKRVVEKRQAS